MKREYTVKIHDLTENDLRNVFYDTFEQLGVTAGDKIPTAYVDVREELIRQLFKKGLDSK